MIKLKTNKDIEILAESGEILSSTLKKVAAAATPGVKLAFLDQLAEDNIRRAGGKPAFLNYWPEGAQKPYPASLCTSIGSTIVHGIPGGYSLKAGDVLKIDLGVDYNGHFTDSATTVIVGGTDDKNIQRLISGTKEALDNAILACVIGGRLGDIGAAVEGTAKRRGLRPVEALAGHGVGFMPHEDPMVWNFGNKGTGIILKEGLVIAIEPMLTLGHPDIVEMPDGSYKTMDNSITAHFEHTVAITEEGPRVLTA
ncbi:MAG: type I methionyl aminopeptidase [Candidatus Colwellbacteria bacterium]|nr:type I methionyl aminopeptidase [Candidatus Colwellbacteria bacterium]